MSAQSILILEDEPLIALDIECCLQDGGFENVTVLGSCVDAQKYISAATPALAIVDLHLKDGIAIDVCRELASRNVPIIVSSGAVEGAFDDFLQTVHWLPKPISSPDLLNSVAAALRQPDHNPVKFCCNATVHDQSH